MSLKSVLIAGCSDGGIGSALAKAFQKRNVHVFATAHNTSKMSSLQGLPNTTLLQMDPTFFDSVLAAFKIVKDQTNGKLDYLVSNAGKASFMPTLEVDIEKAKEMLEINVCGIRRTISIFSSLLIAVRGTIFNISSVYRVLHGPFKGIYAGSSSAVEKVSEDLAFELGAPFNFRIFTVVLGPVHTNICNSDDGPFSLPENSVEWVVDGVARGHKGYAEIVVSDALEGKSGQVWTGAGARTFKVVGDWFTKSWKEIARKRVHLHTLENESHTSENESQTVEIEFHTLENEWKSDSNATLVEGRE